MAIKKPKTMGFTLVELLVVIAIIGVLVGMIMPAVQAARENARRSTCQNNLRQIATAIQGHHTQKGYYPSSGWGYTWTGDPDMGFGHQQPGGWIFSILPFMGRENVYKLGQGATGANKQGALQDQMEAVIGLMICPSRRRVMTYPATAPQGAVNAGGTPPKVAKTDYAINSGTLASTNPGPDLSFLERYPNIPDNEWNPPDSWIKENFTGISGPRTQIGSAHVTDGEGNTYLVGEKYLNPAKYLNGTDAGDNNSMYQGYGPAANRWTAARPMQDMPGAGTASMGFGSAHSSGFNMAMCDMSVRQINYHIDHAVHRALGTRSGGEMVDEAEWKR